MQPGKILVEWEADGKLNVKTSLPVGTSEGKQTAIRVLLDAVKAFNDSGTRLEVPLGMAPARLLGGVR